MFNILYEWSPTILQEMSNLIFWKKKKKKYSKMPSEIFNQHVKH